MKIIIISSSVRKGRKSHRVALYLKRYIGGKGIADAEILDLNNYKFPLFDERLEYQEAPSPEAAEFAAKISSSDGVIIVTPEYNGGYPASLKNAIDLMYREWYHKPVAISTVSDGSFGGSQVIVSLQFILWKMKALVVPAMLPVPEVAKNFDDSGIETDSIMGKRTANFINELVWVIEARSKMGPVK